MPKSSDLFGLSTGNGQPSILNMLQGFYLVFWLYNPQMVIKNESSFMKCIQVSVGFLPS